MKKNLFMEKIVKKAKNASQYLSDLHISKRNSVLKDFSKYLKNYSEKILKENRIDLINAKKKNAKNYIVERLRLDHQKILVLKLD